MSEQLQVEVPEWRNHRWLGRHLFYANRRKNLQLLKNYNDVHEAWFPTAVGSATWT
jgi:hypothetical protein